MQAVREAFLNRREALRAGGAALLACGLQTAGDCAGVAGIEAAAFRRPGMADVDVLRAALAAWQARGGGTLTLEAKRRYDLGQITSGPDLFALGNLSQATLDGNGATIRAMSAPGLSWNLFSISNVSDLLIRNLAATDAGFRFDAWGMKMIVLQPGTIGTSGVRLANVTADRALSFVQAQGPVAPRRVRGVSFGPGCVARRSYYALCCINQGDEISGAIQAVDCRRAYLVYGAETHRVTLAINHGGPDHGPASRSPVLIKSYGRPTRNLSVSAHFEGSLPWNGLGPGDPGSCAMLEQQPDAGSIGLIEGIDLTLDIDAGIPDPFHARLLTLSSVAPDGSEERRTQNIWRDIAVHVHSDRTREIAAPVSPADPVTITVSGDVSHVAAALASNVAIIS